MIQKYCDQCDRHCPLDALRCGRGYRMYGNSQQEDMQEHNSVREADSRRERRPENHHDDREGHRGGFDHGRGPRDEHGPHSEHHGPHHGHHGHGPSAEDLQNRLNSGDLTELIHMCGHIMHHRPEAGAARGQGKILAILAGEGSLSQKQVQEMLHIQPGSMSEIVTKLENKGLLTRTRGEDRRGNILTITDAGRRAAQTGGSGSDDLFSALSADQQQQLRSLLQVLLTDWLHRFDPRFNGRA